MKTGLLVAAALPGAVSRKSPHVLSAAGVVSSARGSVLCLLVVALLCCASPVVNGQHRASRQVRQIAAPRSTEIPGGSRVTLVSDAPLDGYTAYRAADRFHVLIPRADLASAVTHLSGSGFTGIEVERKGDDVDVSFSLQPAAVASVNQKFNRLDVTFTMPSAAAAASVTDAATRAAATAQVPAQEPAKDGAAFPVAQKVSFKPTPDPTPAPTPAPKEAADATSKNGTPAAGKAGGSSEIVLPPEKTSPVSVRRFDAAPVIDGKLDDAVWQQAAVFKDFFQFRPGDNIAPSQPTEVMVGFDAKFLYIAFRAHDEAGKVRATVPKRDQIFDDDSVGMYLDTFNDRRRAYVLIFNPLGVQADGIFTEGSGEDYSLDIVMESKGVVTDEGFTVEIAIPFKSLRYEAGKDKLWGVHFFRQIKRNNNETDSWMPIKRDISAFLSQSGHITGLEGISTERTLELIPSLTISETGRRVSSFNPPPAGVVDPGRMVNEPVKLDPGLTMKYGITPTVTLDLALNPDFAQVEADQTVITANQRFPIFFAEKRPFFLEGIDIFQTPLQAVHTRAIVDPDVAIKLSGKRGRNTFGLMVASDNGPGNLSADDRGRLSSCFERRALDPTVECTNERFLDKNAYIGVLRLKRDIGQENSIGMIATTYNFIEKHNQLLGFDGRVRFNKQTVASFQAIGTSSRNFFFDPQVGESRYRTGNAFAYLMRVDKDGRNFGWNYDGRGFTKDYRADVGFTRRPNTNRHGLFVYYNTDPKPKAKIVRQHYHVLPEINFDWQGRIQSWGHEMQTEIGFQNQTFAGLGVSLNYERIFEEEFGPTRQVLSARCFSDEQLQRNPGLHCGFAGQDSERQTMRNNIYGYFGATPGKKYSVFVFMIHNWGAFDFDFGAGPNFPRVSPAAIARRNCLAAGADPIDCVVDAQDPGKGNQLHLEANLTYQPTDALRLTLDYTKDRLVRRDTGGVAYDDNIFTLRGTYQFTRFTFARARIDYDTLAANMRGQFLLGWAPNPGTSFYVGYNDDMNYNGFGPFTGSLEPGFRRNGRTFFIKMSYLFRRSF